jgi:hypothetical protein
MPTTRRGFLAGLGALAVTPALPQLPSNPCKDIALGLWPHQQAFLEAMRQNRTISIWAVSYADNIGRVALRPDLILQLEELEDAG